VLVDAQLKSNISLVSRNLWEILSSVAKDCGRLSRQVKAALIKNKEKELPGESFSPKLLIPLAFLPVAIS
jgi:hypothetical protein